MTACAPTPWWRRRDERWLVILALTTRLAFLAAWPETDCIRDECLYLRAARRLLRGQGITPTNGWLWAPAYPVLLALHGLLLGDRSTVKLTQCVLGPVAAVALRRLAAPLFGRRAALLAGLAWALSPTHAFFAASLWSEGVHVPLLILLVHRLLRHRHDARGTAWTGVLLGAIILLRGITLWMTPALLAGLLAGRLRERRAWRQAGAVLLAAALVVAPYSAWASQRFGGLVISDRTVGQMLWLGNNDFPPLSFDWALGPDDRRELDAVFATGRPHCAPPDAPIERDRCEREAALAWIRAHPRAFLARVPVRLAQLMNPNSLLTRHIRWGRLPGMPPLLAEGLVLAVVAWSLLASLGGPLAALRTRHGRDARALLLLTIGTWLVHAAAIALTAGLSRYRAPLEPLWYPWVGLLLARAWPGPREPAPQAAPLPPGRHPVRTLAGGALLLLLAALAACYLPAAWVRAG